MASERGTGAPFVHQQALTLWRPDWAICWKSFELHVRITSASVRARAAGCGVWTHLYQQLFSATYARPSNPTTLEAVQTISDPFFPKHLLLTTKRLRFFQIFYLCVVQLYVFVVSSSELPVKRKSHRFHPAEISEGFLACTCPICYRRTPTTLHICR